MVGTWLTQRLEMMGALVILLTAIIIVALRNQVRHLLDFFVNKNSPAICKKKKVGPGFAGLAISYSLNIVVNLNFSVKQATLVCFTHSFN